MKALLLISASIATSIYLMPDDYSLVRAVVGCTLLAVVLFFLLDVEWITLTLSGRKRGPGTALSTLLYFAIAMPIILGVHHFGPKNDKLVLMTGVMLAMTLALSASQALLGCRVPSQSVGRE
ncbi:hypothetical protein K227x_23360 [Rubripirellula lacrimiformis]|uniref:Uncharacterized protein n=1 Tax=Rubripirellula lacrimiformis TaxID=1930273 RepID=A0A517N9Z5_9BACT|nr:hypothetical protein [Rubripirellula lacrimiformis]QDT03950.1 hypothetical protein K227x_23360 [Rubripirellula lacrimiformis]